MARNAMTRDDIRELWRTNVSPLVVAAREGASHANRVGHREWARTHRRRRLPGWVGRWRDPWVALAAGLAVVGVVGALRTSRARRAPVDPDLAAVRDEAKAGVRARMEAGRERLGAAAREATRASGAPASPAGSGARAGSAPT